MTGALVRTVRGIPRKAWIAVTAIVVIVAAGYGGWRVYTEVTNTHVTAYFSEAKGIFPGDKVLYLGVPVGTIDSITPEPNRVRMTFHFESKYRVPAEAKVVVMSPSLVSSRSIQMTPGYSGGPTLADGAVIGEDRTAVPVEWDDFRAELERISSALSPDARDPNGSLGRLIDTAQHALDGRGETINSTLTKLSAAASTLNDNRGNLFATLKGLEQFVTAVASSQQQIVAFNGRLAAITTSLDGSDQVISTALTSLDAAVADLTQFLNDNNSKIVGTVNGLSGVGETLQRSKSDIENLLHTAPTAFANFVNIYQPEQNALTGALAFTNFKNPMQFICGAIQAASQLNAADAAKLCVDKLGPLLSSVAVNYPPIGINPIVGPQAQPKDVDYSEEWLRRLTAAGNAPGQAN